MTKEEAREKLTTGSSIMPSRHHVYFEFKQIATVYWPARAGRPYRIAVSWRATYKIVQSREEAMDWLAGEVAKGKLDA